MIFRREKVKQKRERTGDRLPLVFPVHPLSLTAFTSPASALLIWLWWFLSSSSPSFYLDLIHTPSTTTTHSTPTPFLIPAFLSLFFPLSGILTIHLHPPTPFLSIVTAACLIKTDSELDPELSLTHTHAHSHKQLQRYTPAHPQRHKLNKCTLMQDERTDTERQVHGNNISAAHTNKRMPATLKCTHADN